MRLSALIILARLLDPTDFGLVAMVTVFLTIWVNGAVGMIGSGIEASAGNGRSSSAGQPASRHSAAAVSSRSVASRASRRKTR